METNGLLIRMIGKGGMLGECAKMCLNNEEKGKEFIKLCHENLDNESVQEIIGEMLITDIKKYSQKGDFENNCLKNDSS